MGVTPIKMPQLGESVTEGTVDKWLKREGDYVERDEPLVEVVTDKVNAEVPSPFAGRLQRIAIDEGATVPIGAVIAEMEVEGAGAAAAPAEAAPAEPAASAARAAPAETAPPEPAVPAAATAPAPAEGPRPRLSPVVRRLVEEHGVDLSQLQGSGDGGRITRDDVLAFVERRDRGAAPAPAAAPPPTPAAPAAPAADGREELVPLNTMRRSIAEHMVRSVTTAPHAWTLVEVDVAELVRYREAEKDGFRQRHGVALTYLPFVIQVVCDALRAHPHLNATWTDDGILVKHYINMGIAVAVPDGLLVPVIHGADQLGFADLARAIDDLSTRARTKRLRPEDVQGGTFTLNNTGANGSIASGPIINQPQAAILTTERIVKRPVVVGEDGIAVRPIMNMCMSFDHRVIDGKTAGDFVNFVKDALERWTPASIRM
ncbi:MAG TPA: dihydrolipoamide acetyltransferase family protein [Candidatus Binatia bacterium]|nr:dihydrolipoamide acetyltransferase family protein [Candidatus Binatia bacterium]